MEMFQRKIYERMLAWKREQAGRTALLIKGARRVGKSTIVEEFARREYDSYLLIDFSTAEQTVRDLFTQLADIDLFFASLQALSGARLVRRKSVIVLDEVQLCPAARQAVKHLVKDGRYDYIETGSLLSIKKNVRGIVIPSEETRIEMHPMDFEEFLRALGTDGAMEAIRYAFSHRQPLGEAAHRKLMRQLRLYMLVGGMPQAISAYIEAGDFVMVDQVKRNILELYADDFHKIDPTGRISRLFQAIPSELSHASTRFHVGRVVKNATMARLGGLLGDMADSMTVNFAYNANDPSAGFALHSDQSAFKLFLADTGLFVTLAFMDSDSTDSEVYRKLLFDKLSTDLGYIYENLVAQMLRAAGHRLFYHAFKQTIEQDGEQKERPYEIDFLLSESGKICPVEVKSSGYKTHKSLDVFCAKFSQRIAQPYVIHTKDLRREQTILCLPTYMTGLL